MKVIFFAFLMGLAACAKANWADESSRNPATAEKAAYDCSLQFQNSKICVSWIWTTPPTEETPGTMDIKVYTLGASKAPIPASPSGPLSVLLWMPSMGHGSSPVKVQQLEVGHYQATNVFFVMPGEWQIKFQIKSGNSVTDEAVDKITL